MAKSIVTIKKDGSIAIGDCKVGTYCYHKLGGYDRSGNKLVPFYYTVELINGNKFSVVYSQKDIRAIVVARWQELLHVSRDAALKAFRESIDEQFKEMKAKHPDAILLFRVGDFYESYYDDAREVTSVLGITLTNRGGQTMAGFPKHALDSYLPRLVRAGKRVAICEYIESTNR